MASLLWENQLVWEREIREQLSQARQAEQICQAGRLLVLVLLVLTMWVWVTIAR